MWRQQAVAYVWRSGQNSLIPTPRGNNQGRIKADVGLLR